jgi:hypothetical protein
VADHQTAALHHFQHYDLFDWQTELAESPIVREAARAPEIAYAGKAAFHNLEFYSSWMNDLRRAVRQRAIGEFIKERVQGGARYVDMLGKALPGIFE